MLIPKFVYPPGGGGTTLTLSHPMRAHTPEMSIVGGERTIANGQSEAFELREDQLVNITVVCLESEWPDFVALLRWAIRHKGTSFSFHPDKNGAALSVTMTKPRANDSILPRRSANFPGAYEYDLTLRSPTSTVFDIRLFP